mgnify:FL=1
MTLTIEYKSDRTSIPYCAYTYVDGEFMNAWSAISFEDAKARLLTYILKDAPQPLPPEKVEI